MDEDKWLGMIIWRQCLKLVNAFLDGSIEKETYLVKKDELIKTKTDLNKRKSDFGRKGNNWIEPLRNWINTAHHAEKLTLSNNFYEIKSLTEKIGTNRRLLSRKTEFEFVRPYDLIPKYRAFAKRDPPKAGRASNQTPLNFQNVLIGRGAGN